MCFLESQCGRFRWEFAQKGFTQRIRDLKQGSVWNEPWENQTLRLGSEATAGKKKLLHHLNYAYSDGPAGKPLKNSRNCPGEKNKASPSPRPREHSARSIFYRSKHQVSNRSKYEVRNTLSSYFFIYPHPTAQISRPYETRRSS